MLEMFTGCRYSECHYAECHGAVDCNSVCYFMAEFRKEPKNNSFYSNRSERKTIIWGHASVSIIKIFFFFCESPDK